MSCKKKMYDQIVDKLTTKYHLDLSRGFRGKDYAQFAQWVYDYCKENLKEATFDAHGRIEKGYTGVVWLDFLGKCTSPKTLAFSAGTARRYLDDLHVEDYSHDCGNTTRDSVAFFMGYPSYLAWRQALGCID